MPTPGAMRAAGFIVDRMSTRHPTSAGTIAVLAEIIDRETGAKELREACKHLVQLADSNDCPRDRLKLLDALVPIADEARAALAT